MGSRVRGQGTGTVGEGERVGKDRENRARELGE